MRWFGIFPVMVLGLSVMAVGTHAETILAGAESPGDAPNGPDSWYQILCVDEANPFDFTASGQTRGYVTSFTFYAKGRTDRTEEITPFVVGPQSANNFIVRAIGTTRREGVDWTEAGLKTFRFDETDMPLVEQGWMAGFITSFPDGSGGGSPLPYENTGREGWLTGNQADTATTPRIELGQPPVEGGSTWADGLGRFYQFSIGALPAPEPSAVILLIVGLAAVTAQRPRR
jgi:hypothetical protein